MCWFLLLREGAGWEETFHMSVGHQNREANRHEWPQRGFQLEKGAGKPHGKDDQQREVDEVAQDECMEQKEKHV